MENAVPIILLAFANDRQGQFLRSIAAEQQAISTSLRETERAGRCDVVSLPNAGVSDIIRVFQEERGRVRIFHYGGHADGDQLHLNSSSGNVVDGQSLANFLGNQDDLELVFLNGCSTYGQKDGLLAAGVKRVIITDKAIHDNAAQHFSSQFYKSLATGMDIEAAFKEAASGTLLHTGGDKRHLFWEDNEPEADDGVSRGRLNGVCFRGRAKSE